MNSESEFLIRFDRKKESADINFAGRSISTACCYRCHRHVFFFFFFISLDACVFSFDVGEHAKQHTATTMSSLTSMNVFFCVSSAVSFPLLLLSKLMKLTNLKCYRLRLTYCSIFDNVQGGSIDGGARILFLLLLFYYCFVNIDRFTLHMHSPFPSSEHT